MRIQIDAFSPDDTCQLKMDRLTHNSESPLVWLLQKHFPEWLSSEDKESLLEHFGAVEAKPMASSGKAVSFSCSIHSYIKYIIRYSILYIILL